MKKIIAASLAAFLFTAIFSISFAEDKADGKKIFEDNKCSMCHSVSAAEIVSKKGDKYPDLSKLEEVQTAELYTEYLHKKEKLHGKKHPVPFKGSDEEMKVLLEWIISLNTKAE